MSVSKGPIYGGFIESFSNWRWCFYVIIIWSFLVFLALFVGTPETFSPVILVKKARALRESTGEQGYHAQHEKDLEGKSIAKTIAISGTRVFTLLAYEPMLFLLCLWSAMLLGILYLFFELYRECASSESPSLFLSRSLCFSEDEISFSLACSDSDCIW